MYDRLLTELKHFLKRHWKPGRAVVLACSGGPDSKALLHLLVQAKIFFDLDIHVAHIDHGWRAESRCEALELQKEVEELGLPFHLSTLEEALPQTEEVAREARYESLQEIVECVGAQAVLLAHQMEDQAEVVLKRLLEGASIPSCGGMRQVSTLKGMTIWRPLLSVSKQDLIQWLGDRDLLYFTDSTNLDPRYLRGRFRTSIIPHLEATFGKGVMKNLCLFGERAQKLEDHLTRLSQPLWEQKVGSLKECEEVVVEFFLKAWSRRQGLHLSRDELAALAKKVRSEDPQQPIELALKIQSDYLNH